MQNWSPESWQTFKVTQQATYPEQSSLSSVINELKSLPPLVSVAEIEDLKVKLASAARGQSFVLQGGDCAELFSDCNAEAISSKLKILLQMSLLLMHGLNKPVIKIGRLAGQYAKPRSAELETLGGVELPSYRGDLINGAKFLAEERRPDPKRLLKGYSFASLTLNYIRTLIENKFADFSNMASWDLDFIAHSPFADEFNQVVNQIRQSVVTQANLNIRAETNQQSNQQARQKPSQQAESIPLLNSDKLFTCHEALHLQYEQALTRQHSDANWYNLSTHLPWIGMRTAQAGSAHLEYMRGITNPVAVKIGPSTQSEELLRICAILDPNNSPGKLTLITRFGDKNIKQLLPPLIKAVQKANRQPLWCCDPMHGNTVVTQSGIKTRLFDSVIGELSQAFKIHHELGSHLGGVHFELTGEQVTECVGGARDLTELDLARAYKSLVDPRLNADQALEMAVRIVKLNQQLN